MFFGTPCILKNDKILDEDICNSIVFSFAQTFLWMYYLFNSDNFLFLRRYHRIINWINPGKWITINILGLLLVYEPAFSSQLIFTLKSGYRICTQKHFRTCDWSVVTDAFSHWSKMRHGKYLTRTFLISQSSDCRNHKLQDKCVIYGEGNNKI